MDKLDMKQTLDGLAQAGVPAGVDLWPGVRARLRPAARRGGLRRAGWAGLALAGLLALGATAYAASPVIYRLLALDDQLKPADAERLGRTLDLSQTQGDLTVTVEWAYADGQRVLVGYSLTTADGRRFDPGQATLSDSRGQTLHSTGGYGVTGHSDVLDVSLPPGASSNIAVFDRPAGAAPDSTLKLHLSLSANEYAPPRAATPAAVVNGTPSDTTAQAQPVVLLASAGPFEFDFEVPVVRAK